MTGCRDVIYTQQNYNLCTSFFIELRNRVLLEGLPYRTEIGIHALSAVDGSLWLDKQSFKRRSCRFKDCLLSSCNLRTRYLTEEEHRTSRCPPADVERDDCGCNLVPGTLVLVPSLRDFRSLDLQWEVNKACGPTSFRPVGNAQMLGITLNASTWPPDAGGDSVNQLKRFLMTCYVDVKSCKSHFALASPIVKPNVSWSCLGHVELNAAGSVTTSHVSASEPFHLKSELFWDVIDYCNKYPVKCGLFAVLQHDYRGTIVVDIYDIKLNTNGNISITDNSYDAKNIIIGAVGTISPHGTLPRPLGNAFLMLFHLLDFHDRVVNLMLIDPKALCIDNERGDVNIRGSIAALYTVLLGPPLSSTADVTVNCGYKSNPDYLKMGTLKHEHVLDFLDSVDTTINERIEAELNLQLMRWRIVPQLKPPAITDLNVCIIGVGALGCAVIRQLLAWGARKYVLIDNGLVRNSTRQCLYSADDSAKNTPKVFAACREIKRVYSGAQAIPVEMQVPMPGHFINEEAMIQDYQRLKNVMLDCDVVFLLTDTKESRWLPSLIGAAHSHIHKGRSTREASLEAPSAVSPSMEERSVESPSVAIKVEEELPSSTLKPGPLIISAGVAFDSFMVIRHGYGSFHGGCYFCSDVRSPTDSISGRPMDEVCTVVKPGVIASCAATATELLISLTQHPEGFQAPHGSYSCLGEVPHAIRMSFADFSLEKLHVEASKNCICCSNEIVDAFRCNPMSFLKKATAAPDYIIEKSGLHTVLESVASYTAMDAVSESDFVII